MSSLLASNQEQIHTSKSLGAKAQGTEYLKAKHTKTIYQS